MESPSKDCSQYQAYLITSQSRVVFYVEHRLKEEFLSYHEVFFLPISFILV
jgi:hypothetical protein